MNGCLRHYLSLPFVLVLLVSGFIYNWKGVGTVYLYRNVTITAAKQNTSLNTWWTPPAEYLVKDGELYLRVQKTKLMILLLGNTTRYERWTAARLHTLTVAHPELLKLLPRPEAPDHGVVWLATPEPAP